MTLLLTLLLACGPPPEAVPAAPAAAAPVELAPIAASYLADPERWTTGDPLDDLALLADPAFEQALRSAAAARFEETAHAIGLQVQRRGSLAEADLRGTDGHLEPGGLVLERATPELRIAVGPLPESALRTLEFPGLIDRIAIERTFDPAAAEALLRAELGPEAQIVRIRGSYDLGPLFAFRTTSEPKGWYLAGSRAILGQGPEQFAAAVRLAGVGRRDEALPLKTFARVFSVFHLGREQMLMSEAAVGPEHPVPTDPTYTDQAFDELTGARYRFWLWGAPGPTTFWDVRVAPDGRVSTSNDPTR